MEAFFILLAIFALCWFAKWFLMKPVGPMVEINNFQSELTPAQKSGSASVKADDQASDIFEGKIISEFPEIDYSELDEPTFIRRNISIFTLDDAASWFGSKILSIFEVIDYSEYESPTYKRRKIAAALLRKERAKAAKLRKAAEAEAIPFVETKPETKTKRRIATDFLQFQPAIIA